MIESVQDSLRALRSTIDRLTADGIFGGLSVFDPDERRWAALHGQLAEDLSGERVLDVSDDSSFAFAFAARGAAQVLACGGAAGTQSCALERIELRPGWEGLNPGHDGPFDLVHSHGLLHRTLEPLALLRALRAVIAPGGELLIGSLLLADPERSEYIRFLPEDRLLVPGRLAFRWLVQAAGFDVHEEFGELPGRWGNLLTLNSYLRARPRLYDL
jgi:SAM-dependent methyltransferase